MVSKITDKILPEVKELERFLSKTQNNLQSRLRFLKPLIL